MNFTLPLAASDLTEVSPLLILGSTRHDRLGCRGFAVNAATVTRKPLGCTLTLLVLVLAASVSAQPGNRQLSVNAGEAGEADFVSAAKKHFRQRQYVEAIAEFQAAYEVERNSVRLYNIGKCYERLRETARALRYFREYLRIEPTAARDDVLKSEIANAERQLEEEAKRQTVFHAEPAGDQVLRHPELQARSVRVRARGFPSQPKGLVVGTDGDAQLSFRLRKRGVTKRDVTLGPTPPQPVASNGSSEPLGAGLPSESTGEGWLTLRTEPWCDVYLSGEHLDTTPINRLSFPAGKYSLRLVNESARIDKTLKVEIRTGEESTARLMLEPEEPVVPE